MRETKKSEAIDSKQTKHIARKHSTRPFPTVDLNKLTDAVDINEMLSI